MPSDRKRILIVDEDQLLGEFYACLLSLQGFVPVLACDGEMARSIIVDNHQTFALAVIDLLPPTDEYWDLVKLLRQTPATAETPIMTITGISLSYEELDRIKKCCHAVLMKGSFELSKFKETVSHLCRN